MAVRPTIKAVIGLLAGLALGGPAAAQLLGGHLPTGSLLPGVQIPSLRDLDETVGRVADPRALTDIRLVRLRDLVRANPRDLELDPQGAPIVRDEIIAIAVAPDRLQRAQEAGFRVVRSEPLEGLDLTIAILAPPPRLDTASALRRLRRLDPQGQYDFNHLYFGAGASATARAQALPRRSPPSPAAGQPKIGMIDTGLDTGQSGLAGVTVEQRGFAPGGVKPAAHGAAVASLIAGRVAGPAGARLYVADVYGTGPRGGSAEAVIRAFAWLAQGDVQVINVSLVGPANGALQAAVEATARRGGVVVAAVGNDGPAAPFAYPASYPGVIAVTGVDRRDRVLIEAGRATHVDFAAPGADIVAADGRGGKIAVRGTSFAAPLVAGVLARLRTTLDREAAVDALGRQARDLGAKGRDKVFGRGLVGEDVRLAAIGKK